MHPKRKRYSFACLRFRTHMYSNNKKLLQTSSWALSCTVTCRAQPRAPHPALHRRRCAAAHAQEQTAHQAEKSKNKMYPSRESNPGLPRGRRVFYH